MTNNKILTIGATLTILLVAVVCFEKTFFTKTFPIASCSAFLLHISFLVYIICLKIEYALSRNIAHIKNDNANNYKNIEALLTTLATISPRHPISPSRGWAASPDFIHLIVSNILSRKPKKIVELGGGVSTIYSGYALEKNKDGVIYSIEHDRKYLVQLGEDINKHSLQPYAEIILAPLHTIPIGEKEWVWYNIQDFVFEEIDMLIIDGPPSYVQKNARYPALHVLYNSLAKNAVILVDDYYRNEDKNTVDLWLTEYPDLKLIEVPTEKGAAVLLKVN